MAEPRKVQSFVSNSPDYHRAFQAFLDHTDQKQNALSWLRREVDALANRSVMIDAGAGSGTLTAWFTPLFQTVVAIEPNPSLESALRAACPTAVVIADTITAATPQVLGNFVLCSHVFYYIPQAEWEPTLRRLMSWLAPGGFLAIALQNPGTDCMRMVDHFIGGRFDLSTLCPLVNGEGGEFEARVETVPATIRTPNREIACTIAEFVLNVLSMPSPPTWEELEQYVDARFRQADGRYRLTCDQDFLKVHRRAI